VPEVGISGLIRAPSVCRAEGDHRIPGEVRTPIATVGAAHPAEVLRGVEQGDGRCFRATFTRDPGAAGREDPMAPGWQRPGADGETRIRYRVYRQAVDPSNASSMLEEASPQFP